MYNVSVSPHIREQSTTRSIMRDVAIALIPTLAFGVYRFGIGAMKTIALCAAACIAFEALFEVIVK